MTKTKLKINEHKKYEFEEYVPELKDLIKKMCAGRNVLSQTDEATQMALITSWNLWQEYDPSKGVCFKTYVYKPIQGIVITLASDPIMGTSRTPVYKRQQYISDIERHCKDTDIGTLFGAHGHVNEDTHDDFSLVTEAKRLLTTEDFAYLSAWLESNTFDGFVSVLGTSPRTSVSEHKLRKIINILRPKFLTKAEQLDVESRKNDFTFFKKNQSKK